MEGLYREKNGQLSFVPVKEERSKYSYNGPVFLFDKLIARIKLETWANTPAKAYANLVYQAKDQLGYQPNTRITLSKPLVKKEETKYGKSV